MSEGAFELEVRAIGQRGDEGVYFIGRDAQAVHPCIYFQMETYTRGFRRRFAGKFCVQRFCGALEIAHVVHASDRGREMVLYQALFFAGPETCENQDRFANPGAAQLDAFIGAGDAEPFGAGFLQRFGNWDGAEAVGVGLNDSENFPICADVLPDYAQIMDDGLERNLRPNRPAFEMNGFRHRHLEGQTPYRWRERNSGQPG